MQTLCFAKSELPAGQLPATEPLFEIEAVGNTIVGVYVRNETPVENKDIDTGELMSYGFSFFHLDCNCEATLKNALELFGVLAAKYGCKTPTEDEACALVAPYIKPRNFSKLALYVALSRMGLWEKLVEWMNKQVIEGANAYMAFTFAQELTESHPLFSKWFAEAKKALGVGDAVAEGVLAACAISD